MVAQSHKFRDLAHSLFIAGFDPGADAGAGVGAGVYLLSQLLSLTGMILISALLKKNFDLLHDKQYLI